MIVWDNHTCLPLRPNDADFLPQLGRAKDAGVTVTGVNIGFADQGINEHVRMLAHFRKWFGEHDNEYVQVRSIQDIQRAHESARLAVFFDMEGSIGLGGQLSMIKLYYDLGVRWMSMAYNLNNEAGGGCLDNDCGLTEFGANVVDEMARVGMMTCCSHTGPRTALDVIEHAVNPVIFSHSNPRALWDHPRNISDEAIRRCAEKGGVVCINGVGAFLGNTTRSETIAANIDYVVRLAGIEHVGIGLDYVYDSEELLQCLRGRPDLFGDDSENIAEPAGFAAPEQLPEIIENLRAIGYAQSDVARVMGTNMLHVAGRIWKS
jgi:membrane dipeptidase